MKSSSIMNHDFAYVQCTLSCCTGGQYRMLMETLNLGTYLNTTDLRNGI